LIGVKHDFVPYYLNALKKHSFSTVEEIEEAIRSVNENVANAEANSKDS
uniref:Pyruvate ferredoxin oxidoreductase n=1 Tax=Gongylonema pulchrum TaxID=637853 RepID=A0A183DLM3_9BILA